MSVFEGFVCLRECSFCFFHLLQDSYNAEYVFNKRDNTELDLVLVGLVPGGGKIDVHRLLVGSNSRQAISGSRVPATDSNIWFIYFWPSLPHFDSMMSDEHFRILRTAQHISEIPNYSIRISFRLIQSSQTWNSFLHIRIDRLVKCHCQITHTASGFLLCGIQTGSMLQIAFPFLRVFFCAEFIIPGTDITLTSDTANEFSHRFC